MKLISVLLLAAMHRQMQFTKNKRVAIVFWLYESIGSLR